MVLYEQAYQYTRLRLYVQFFILLLGAILVLTILKIWRQKFPLAKCVCFAILISLSALSYFNVDGFIARENSRNMPAALKEDSDGMPEDPMGYLYSLSADALPGYAHPVSYTHLDVYKRQPLSMSWLPYFPPPTLPQIITS